MNTKRQPPRVLTIAGSDSGGSAGIQADLKTFTACGVFGASAITVVTAQNTQAVLQAHPLPTEFIDIQIKAVLEDIGVDAIKTGLLGRADVVELVAGRLPPTVPAVVDPVLVNGHGAVIVPATTIDAYRQRLLPLATLITPNLDEACLLADMPSIDTLADMHTAAQRLHDWAPMVLVKGGHLGGKHIVDLFYDGVRFVELQAPALPITNPHGVGCTFASAIAAALAQGASVHDAVHQAHVYVQSALRGALNWELGRGRLAVNHMFDNP